ncbi:hypothetical protein B9Q03_00865 [Candidatus Marsarchaeota G2 archaeon OSP_D]|jgi:cobyrinic acid a,c-diamide synthase|nr:MAG: hypothetical protein B9Q03_00865 [Candidatus Marsarchaeota G2 archaeon OSP_D]
MGYARLVVGGVGSDVGKTTVSTGLMGALVRRGLRVQGFKVGPDYIDPTYHRLASGRPSYNLDTWLMGEAGVVETFASAMREADIGVVEGVMGLFDGSTPRSDAQSTSEVARLLRAPVILVVDVRGVGRSAAAQVLGYAKMAQGYSIRGVVLNRVGGEGHAAICKSAIEEVTGIPVIGALKNTPTINLPSRHLGLHLAEEEREKIRSIVDEVEGSVDIDRILSIAREAPPLGGVGVDSGGGIHAGVTVRVGVALDEAFAFYYEDNFRILRTLGAQLVFFSPERDQQPPNVDALYMGGGYPELKGEALEANAQLRHSIKKLVEGGLPVYAECGGLMYLGRSIETADGRKHTMVGVLDLDTALTRRLTLGYTELEAAVNTLLTQMGETLRGHEFHYSEARNVSSDCRFAYKVRRGRGIIGGLDGCLSHEALASYTHLHFAGYPSFARRFIEAAKLRGRR